MNKYKLYMILGIILLVLSITGSLAYYVWSSSTTSISGNLCLPEIYFTGGATINGKLKPVSSKEEGLIKEMTGYGRNKLFIFEKYFNLFK